MWSRSHRLLTLLVLGCGPLVLSCGRAGASSEPSVAEALTVRSGSIQQRLLLHGELVADEAAVVNAPETDSFQLQIRWLAEDGAEVEAGQRIVQFDNSSVASGLEDKQLNLDQERSSLAQYRAESSMTEGDRLFEIERARANLEKARIDASVPEDLLSRRDYQDVQLALRKAELDLAAAEESLATHRRVVAAEIAKRRLKLSRASREIEEALASIDALEVEAPRSGVVVVESSMRGGGKYQEGDTVFRGHVVLRIPDLETLMVRAVLSDVDAARLSAGAAVRCVLDAYPDLSFPGRVDRISPIAQRLDQTSRRRSFVVIVRLDAVDAERMRPGMSVRVEAEGEAAEGLVAPRRGLDLSGETARAFLAGGGTAEVQLGPCDAQSCLVEEGLSEGDRLRPREVGR